MSFSGGIFIFGVFFKDCWSFKDCHPAPPLWVWLSAGAAGVCWWTGGGEPPGMMGILTCQTPNLPSLSFSSPPPSPRGTGPPLCPCPSQELNSEEHLCKCSVRFHRVDFGAPVRLWALGLGLLLAAHLGAFPSLVTLSCPAHSVSSCPSQGRATLEVWAGAEGTRAGLLAFLSPWPYSLMSSFSDSGCAQVWFCSSDSDLSGLLMFRKNCGVG